MPIIARSAVAALCKSDKYYFDTPASLKYLFSLYM